MKKTKTHRFVIVLALAITFMNLNAQTPGPLQTIVYPGITICTGGTANLDAGCGFNAFSWSTGATTQMISVNTSGTYTVQVTDASGFSFIKEFNVTVNPPVNLNLSNVEVCSGNQGTLDAGAGFASYLWSNGATTQNITAGVGNYSVTVTDQNGCAADGNASVVLSSHCTTVPCNIVKSNFYGAYTTAQAIPGAYGYRFNFYDVTNPTVLAAQKSQVSNYIYFAQVSGLFYNHQYIWTVQVEYQPGVYGPESKFSCPIIFNAAETTLNNCGKTWNNFYGTYTTCIPVTQALNYRFTFYDVNNPTAIAGQKTQTSNYIYFAQVPGLHYDHQYISTVEVEYPLQGGGSTWGPASSTNCILSFGPAMTSVACGRTYTLYTTCTQVTGAIQYQFSFYDVTTGNLVAQKTQASNYIYFNQVAGLQQNVTYNWTVRVQYSDGVNTLWGPESSNSCTMIYSSNSSSRLTNNSSTDETAKEELNPVFGSKDLSLKLNVFPNPTQSDRINVSLNRSGELLPTTYKIYDLNGNLIYQLENATYDESIDVNTLNPGMYLIKAIVGDKATDQKFIKN